jgi:DNA-binding NarL/FixJ family response regulator
MEKISVSIVDDHKLFRNGIAELIGHFEEYRVISQSGNGKEFIESIESGIIPQMAILDIQMPVMNGEETAKWLQVNQPQIKVLALSMHDDERNILRMVKAGARGYVLKSAEPEELKLAMDQIWLRNFYHSDLVAKVLVKNLIHGGEPTPIQFNLAPQELQFLQLICSDMTYKEIADEMVISTRVVDSIRENLFERFSTKSRIGLAMFAIKNDLVKV